MSNERKVFRGLSSIFLNHSITDSEFFHWFNPVINRVINNGNCTEWSAIWCEIKRVITKLHDREAGVQFVSTSLISHQNCTTRSAISTLFYSF